MSNTFNSRFTMHAKIHLIIECSFNFYLSLLIAIVLVLKLRQRVSTRDKLTLFKNVVASKLLLSRPIKLS